MYRAELSWCVCVCDSHDLLFVHMGSNAVVLSTIITSMFMMTMMMVMMMICRSCSRARFVWPMKFYVRACCKRSSYINTLTSVSTPLDHSHFCLKTTKKSPRVCTILTKKKSDMPRRKANRIIFFYEID